MQKSSYVNSVNINAGSNFPYLVLNVFGDNVFPRNPGFRIMHWHEDLQFIYVLEGSVLVKTLETEEILSAGEGIFINKNIIHLVEKIADCRYNSFLFPEYFLHYYQGCPVEALTAKLTEEAGITYILLRRHSSWSGRVLDILKELVMLEKDKENTFYCPEVLMRLNELWLILLKSLTYPASLKEAVPRKGPECFSHILKPITQRIFLWRTLPGVPVSANRKP